MKTLNQYIQEQLTYLKFNGITEAEFTVNLDERGYVCNFIANTITFTVVVKSNEK